MRSYLFKRHINLSLSIAISLIAGLTSCKKDISEEELTILVPYDGYQTQYRTIQFKWEEMKNAEFYQIQIVRPSFDSTEWYTVDSTISSTEFIYTLDPGTYQWRVRGGNSGSMTPYTAARGLRIDSTNDLTGQSVVLTSPLDGNYTNDPNPTLTWYMIDIADDYEVQVRQGTSWLTGIIADSSTVMDASYTVQSSLSEAQYTWGVRATNGLPSQTDFTTRSLAVDLTVPGIPTGLSPDGSTFFSGASFTYQWSRAIDNGTVQSPIADSVFIYSDVGLTTLYKRFESTSTSKLDSISQVGTYYWYVKSFDEAGNVGSISAVAQVSIQ